MRLLWVARTFASQKSGSKKLYSCLVVLSLVVQRFIIESRPRYGTKNFLLGSSGFRCSLNLASKTTMENLRSCGLPCTNTTRKTKYQRKLCEHTLQWQASLMCKRWWCRFDFHPSIISWFRSLIVRWGSTSSTLLVNFKPLGCFQILWDRFYGATATFMKTVTSSNLSQSLSTDKPSSREPNVFRDQLQSFCCPAILAVFEQNSIWTVNT